MVSVFVAFIRVVYGRMIYMSLPIRNHGWFNYAFFSTVQDSLYAITDLLITSSFQLYAPLLVICNF